MCIAVLVVVSTRREKRDKSFRAYVAVTKRGLLSVLPFLSWFLPDGGCRRLGGRGVVMR